MRPTSEGEVAMFHVSNRRSLSFWQSVGMARVPAGPMTSRRASITVSAPPTRKPMLLSEL